MCYTGISRVVVDPKNSKADHSPRVYVPYDDPLAKRYFTALSKRMNGKLEVRSRAWTTDKEQ